MKLFEGRILSTLLLIVAANAQTCTQIQDCDLKIDDNCYAHVDDSINWNEAESCCVEWGGHLASVHSAGANLLLNDIRNDAAFTWIGLSDTANNGVYVWTDGTSFDYNNFAPSQPDSLGGESCFHFFNARRGADTWNDYHCNRNSWGSVRTSYICQKKILDRAKCDLTQNGKCYISVNTATTWRSAEDMCVEWGGHLASIHSDLENFAVNSIRDTSDFTWIGLSDTANNGVYVWTDGTPFDYSNFAAGQPDSLGGESCFHLFNQNRGELSWNDYHCNRNTWGNVQTSFVCKKDQILPLKGEPGEAGVPGTPGPQGPQGTQGDHGHIGQIGPRGYAGINGEIGPRGYKGQHGQIGLPGAKGEFGETGPLGKPGIKGEIGPEGNTGPQGETGHTGTKGEKGDSAFPWVDVTKRPIEDAEYRTSTSSSAPEESQ